MSKIVAEVDRVIRAITRWEPITDPNLAERGARAWRGEGEGWAILVASWPAKIDQNNVVTLWGYDGTATNANAGLVMRLTRELAELAATRAK